MKALKKTIIVILSTILLMVVVSFFLPSKVTIMRGIYVRSKSEKIFSQINNFRNWYKWSPWHKMDTNMLTKYEGNIEGEGAKFSWTSKIHDVGNGMLTIEKSYPNDSIFIDMNFMESGNSKAKFVLKNYSDSTLVSWFMYVNLGWNPFLKFIGLQLDSYIGKDFEKGLKLLKIECEKMEMNPNESIKN